MSLILLASLDLPIDLVYFRYAGGNISPTSSSWSRSENETTNGVLFIVRQYNIIKQVHTIVKINYARAARTKMYDWTAIDYLISGAEMFWKTRRKVQI